nr:hypothetical protein [Tanacetum cinerariifolium]
MLQGSFRKIDWENPEGGDYPFDLPKPFPLVKIRNRQKVPVDYFFNNDLKYLQGRISTMTYTISLIKTKAAQYDLPGIKDMVPNIWSPVKSPMINMHFGESHIEENNIMRKHGHGYVQEIVVRRADNDLYRFKEGNFLRLRINDIEDMILLVVQNQLVNLSVDDVSDFAMALRMFTRSLVIQKRVEDLQLRVESYQKKINIAKPETTKSEIRKRDPYTPYQDPQGFIYVDDSRRNSEIVTRWFTLIVLEHAEYDESNTFVLERFNTTPGNPVKEILHKLNLPDHSNSFSSWKQYLKEPFEQIEWGHVGDVGPKSLRHGDIKLLLVAFDSQLKVFHPLRMTTRLIKSWEVTFFELIELPSSLRTTISSRYPIFKSCAKLSIHHFRNLGLYRFEQLRRIVSLFELRKLFFQGKNSLIESKNRDEKSRRARIEVIVVAVVGAGVGVDADCCGRGVIGGIVKGMVDPVIVEVFGRTVTCMLRRGGV